MKGLIHGLVQKWPLSHLFFLGNIGQENVFYDILEQKNAFPGNKNEKFKKSINLHFSKGVNPWFWSKNGHISNTFFFLGKRGQENIFYPIVQRQHAVLGYKKIASNSLKIVIFAKGLNHGFGL